MIRILSPVYSTGRTQYKAADVRQAVRLGREIDHLYCIVVHPGKGGRVEICKGSELSKEHIRDTELVIAGIAENMTKAQTLLMQIVDDALKNTGSADPTPWLRSLIEKSTENGSGVQRG